MSTDPSSKGSADLKYVPPSISETAFNCPHCGALAKQFWRTAHAEPMEKDGIPQVWSEAKVSEMDLSIFDGVDQQKEMFEYFKRLSSGAPFFDKSRKSVDYQVANIWFSRCFNCEQLSLWIYDKLAYPVSGTAPVPNPDMPENVRGVYLEASSILDLSPRGASALVRLALELVCIHLLDKPGNGIDKNIATLVANGLDEQIQMALDSVRVIGNKAVHPGQIDLADNRSTASSLFHLLNLIVERLISQPRHIREMYATLPSGAVEAIQRRDKKPD